MIKKVLLGLLLVVGLIFPTMNTEASIHIAGALYMDESSAVKIKDVSGGVREFAVNVYTVDEYNNIDETKTIWFHYSPLDDPNNNSLSVKARYSWDGFNTWDWFITDASSPLGKIFRNTWYYALGYSYS